MKCDKYLYWETYLENDTNVFFLDNLTISFSRFQLPARQKDEVLEKNLLAASVFGCLKKSATHYNCKFSTTSLVDIT